MGEWTFGSASAAGEDEWVLGTHIEVPDVEDARLGDERWGDGALQCCDKDVKGLHQAASGISFGASVDTDQQQPALTASEHQALSVG